MPITVPFYVLSDGYEISGDSQSGYSASVAYLTSWSNAFSFVNQIMGRTTAVSVGPITYHLPYRLPTVGGVSLYAHSFKITPNGASDSDAPTKGIVPGEFFTYAKITVAFAPLSIFNVDPQNQDPGNLNQIDPDEPITACKQSVKSRGKILTRKGSGYKFASDGKPLLGDFGERVTESSLTLNFPKVPYQPWSLLKGAYLNHVNDTAFLLGARGELLLEEFDTEEETQSDGTICQSVTLGFKHQDYDWNKQPRPDTGILGAVVTNSGDPIYPYVEFRDLIDALSYSTVESES